MEKFEELRENSKKRIHIADHILTQTFPLIQDPKLLLAVMENTFLALTYSMSALLYYEKTFKNVPHFADNFESKIALFRENCISKHNLDKNYPELITEIKEIIVAHRKSPIEFVRKDRFVICSDNYRMKTIDINQMKKYVSQAKQMIKDITNLLAREPLYL